MDMTLALPFARPDPGFSLLEYIARILVARNFSAVQLRITNRGTVGLDRARGRKKGKGPETRIFSLTLCLFCVFLFFPQSAIKSESINFLSCWSK